MTVLFTLTPSLSRERRGGICHFLAALDASRGAAFGEDTGVAAGADGLAYLATVVDEVEVEGEDILRGHHGLEDVVSLVG